MDVDFLLIRKMKQGDDEAFDSFVRKYYGDILKYCVYHCSDREYAEDLTQETFVHFLAKLSDYRYKGKTKNCLYTIAGNLCKNYYKKSKEILTEDGELEDTAAITESHEEEIVEQTMLEWAINQLSSDLRDIIELYYFQEMKLTEIAMTLHIGLPLVKYRLRQARTRLQELLGKEEVSYESGRSDNRL